MLAGPNRGMRPNIETVSADFGLILLVAQAWAAQTQRPTDDEIRVQIERRLADRDLSSITVAASPLTGQLENARRLEDGGCAAIVMHSLFMVSAVLEQGAPHFRRMVEGLRYWMTRHEYDSIEAFRGRLNLGHCLNPAHFERMSYQRILHSWGDV